MERNSPPYSSGREESMPASFPLLIPEPNTRISATQNQDSKKRPTLTKRWGRFQDACKDLWIWEISACIFSILCMSAVAGILFRLQDRPLSSWKFSIAPNSLVSVFITLSKSAMLLVVAQGVSQMRWVHYQTGPHPLIELETFDAASRGPWGSLIFLLEMKGRPWIASLGCSIIIFALAMDPFAQQILYFPTRPVGIEDTNNTFASMPYARDLPAKTKVTSGMTHSLWRASLGGLYDLSPKLTYECASSNCSWPPFVSFGYCSTCADVTNTIKSECLQFGNSSQGCLMINYTTPAGISLVIQNGTAEKEKYATEGSVYTITKAEEVNPSPYRMDPRIKSAATARLRGNGSRAHLDDENNFWEVYKSGWEFTSCTVSFCAKVYEHVRSTNGVLSGTTPREVRLVANDASGCWHYAENSEVPSGADCNSYLPADPSELPAGSNNTFITRLGDDAIEGTSIFNLMNFDWNLTEIGDGYTWDVEDGSSLSLRLGKELMSNDDLPGTFNRVAESMTDYIRVNSDLKGISGTMHVQETFVGVAWGWFWLPVALVLLAMVFLALTITTSKSQRRLKSLDAWKSSSLPLLVYGVDGGWAVEEEDEWGGRKGHRSAVEGRLKDVLAQLGVNKQERLRFIRQ